MDRARYGAPWGWQVRVTTVLGGMALGLPTLMGLSGGRFIGYFLAALSIGSLAFIIRGFSLSGRGLEIQRLAWSTRVALTGLREVSVRPDAMRGAWRIWGNGGLFAISGRFSSSQLGRFRAFVTDPARAVVLVTSDGPIVVSPDDPEAFAREARALLGSA